MDFPKSVPGVGLVAGRYVDENQATGQPGTLVTAQAMNALTDEILMVVKDAGGKPDEHDNAQLLAAIKAIISKETESLAARQKALGDGQTWQNVTAFRAANTTFTNLTGRTIFVLAIVDVGPAAELVLDGVPCSLSDYAGTLLQLHPFPVPKDGTYSLNGIGLTGGAKWMELR